MTPDAILLRRYAEEQSEEAFAEFVQRHLPLVYAAAVRRLAGDAHRAKDIAQVVFCAAARDARKLARHAMLTGWLYTATRNAVVDTQRAESRRRTREEEAHALQVGSIDSAAGFEWTRLRPVLDAALDELAADDREAVLLRFFQSRTFAEIGAAVGASEEAARKRVDRALDKLRDRLDRRGISSTSAALAVALAGQAAAAVPAGLAASVTSTAVAAGGAAVGAATFLGLTKLQAGLAAAVVTAGAVGLVRQQQTLADTREELGRQQQRVAALTAQNAALTATRATADAEAGRLRAEQTALKQSLAEATARAAGAPPAVLRPKDAAARAPAPPPPSTTDRSTQAPSPARTTAPQAQRDKLRRRYDPFLRQHGISPAQADRFVELKIAIYEAQDDLQESMRRFGAQGGTKEIEAIRNKLVGPMWEEIRSILGPEAYKAYGDYERTSAFRFGMVESLEPRFASANVPLTPAQADGLAGLLAGAILSQRSRPTDLSTTMTVDWDVVLPKAGDLLAPAQLAVLREFAARTAAGR
ncbi:MAG: sigma-70 family RNA polymerase sigma factor [Verrucomicrobia bacterium]|nr:sigma-70 family RNA polymerase sigma factor [Verrucomicrobiota bacterium]